MPRTLQDDLAADLARTFFDPTRFGERLTLTPKSGAGSLDASGVVKHREATVEDQDVFYENEVIEVQLSRAEVPDVPKRGDQLTRENDPDTVPFGFSGRVLQADSASWVLEYWRPKPSAIGGKSVRRKLR